MAVTLPGPDKLKVDSRVELACKAADTGAVVCAIALNKIGTSCAPVFSPEHLCALAHKIEALAYLFGKNDLCDISNKVLGSQVAWMADAWLDTLRGHRVALHKKFPRDVLRLIGESGTCS